MHFLPKTFKTDSCIFRATFFAPEPVRLTSHQLGLVLMQWHHLVHQQERIRNRLKRHTTSFLKHSSSADDRRRSMALIEDARSTMMDRLMEP